MIKPNPREREKEAKSEESALCLCCECHLWCILESINSTIPLRSKPLFTCFALSLCTAKLQHMWVFLFHFDLVVKSQRTVKPHRSVCMFVCVCWMECGVSMFMYQGVLVYVEHHQQHYICLLSIVVSFYLLSPTKFRASYRKPQYLLVLLCSILWSQNHPFIIVCTNA